MINRPLQMMQASTLLGGADKICAGVMIGMIVGMVFLTSTIITPQAQAQTPDTCRTVLWGDGTLRFHECNDVMITRLNVNHTGNVYIETSADEVSALNECIVTSGKYLWLKKTHLNSDETFSILFNAFERKRPIRLIRLKKNVSVCEIDFVMSDL